MERFPTVEVIVARKSLLAEAGVVVPPTVSEAHVIVPAPWIATEVFVATAFHCVIAPLTVSVVAELTDNVAVLAPVLVKTTALTVWLAVTVIVAPGTIMAVSVEPGTVPPTQDDVLFQLPPDAVLTRVEASAPVSPQPKANHNASAMAEKTFTTSVLYESAH
jgi:hypothetical protein